MGVLGWVREEGVHVGGEKWVRNTSAETPSSTGVKSRVAGPITSHRPKLNAATAAIDGGGGITTTRPTSLRW